jgi:hypothetical protein
LRYGDNTGTSPGVADRFSYQLLDGLISEPGQLPQKLSVMSSRNEL